MLIKPLPVLYACACCPRYGYAARRVARALAQRGLAEAIWLGDAPARVTGRYPIYSLDACDERCASDWVHARGAAVERAFVLEPHERDDITAATECIATAL